MTSNGSAPSRAIASQASRLIVTEADRVALPRISKSNVEDES